MKLEAKSRLAADAQSDMKKQQRETLDKQIKQKRDLIDQQRMSLPSSKNKIKVGPRQKLDKQKNINRIQDQIIDLQKRKMDI